MPKKWSRDQKPPLHQYNNTTSQKQKMQKYLFLYKCFPKFLRRVFGENYFSPRPLLGNFLGVCCSGGGCRSVVPGLPSLLCGAVIGGGGRRGIAAGELLLHLTRVPLRSPRTGREVFVDDGGSLLHSVAPSCLVDDPNKLSVDGGQANRKLVFVLGRSGASVKALGRLHRRRGAFLFLGKVIGDSDLRHGAAGWYEDKGKEQETTTNAEKYKNDLEEPVGSHICSLHYQWIPGSAQIGQDVKFRANSAFPRLHCYSSNQTAACTRLGDQSATKY